jgi:hypothetical protein
MMKRMNPREAGRGDECSNYMNKTEKRRATF